MFVLKSLQMEIYLVYFLKVIILQTILFGFYRLISRKSSSFQFNRYFLLSILIVPFFIPFLRFQLDLFSTQVNPVSAFEPLSIFEQSLPGVVFNGNQAISPELNWWVISIPVIYLMVAISFTIKLIIDYIKIYNLGKKTTKLELSPKGYRLLYVPSKFLSFSFLNKIFLSDLFPLKPHEKSAIITHEEYHLSEKHSFDIIFAELIRILCWFNPVTILIQKNIKETHEYLADRHTIIHHGKNDYTSLLKSFKWHEVNMMLGSGYSSSSIKNRIKMIDRPKQKIPIMKPFVLILITFFTAFIFACEDKLVSFESVNKSVDSEILSEELQGEMDLRLRIYRNAPSDFIEEYKNLQMNNPHIYYMPYITLSSGTTRIDKSKMTRSFLFGDQYTLNYFKKLSKEESEKYSPPERRPSNSIIKTYEFHAYIKSMDRVKYFEHQSKKSNGANIYDKVDRPAKFGGGTSAFSAYLKSNLNYPEIAKEKGIEDRLVMRFVIGTSGGVTYLNVDEEPSVENEEISVAFQREALRVLQGTSGRWTPAEKDGKYVMSKMILPIEFKLEK